MSDHTAKERADSETPIYADAGRYQVFGIHTAPSVEPNGCGVILCAGGSWIPSMNRNRMFVDIARTLAANGYDVWRYEYRGVGESTGPEADYNLRRPFVRELKAGVRVLQDRGVDRIFLFGTCFGAILALYAAPQVPEVSGAVLVSPPLGRFTGAAEGSSISTYAQKLTWAAVKARLTDRRKRTSNLRVLWTRVLMVSGTLGRRAVGRGPRPDNWLAPHLVRAYERVVKARMPLIVVWGDKDPDYKGFAASLDHRVGALMTELGDRGQLIVRPGQVHRFLSSTSQRFMIEGANQWIDWMRERVTDVKSPTSVVEEQNVNA